MGLVDYHVHTAYCGHAEGKMEDYVRAALDMGLAEMGFCDHFPLLHRQDSSLTMPREDLPRYVEDVLRLREIFPELEILLGIEVDYFPGMMGEAVTLLEKYPFDYVVGAVHFLEEWGFDDPRYVEEFQRRDISQVWEEYFRLAEEAVESGIFDVFAHPDLVKKFGHFPPEPPVQLYRGFCEAARRSGVVVEVSTAGLRKPVGEIYPSEELLRMLCQHGVPVTLASDAHRPSEVGYAFGEALLLLRRAGYLEITGFRRRRRHSIPLPG
jgi:histidinol-phosphatase (PHP family)